MTTGAITTQERRYLQELLIRLSRDSAAVVLVGSRARGTVDEWSDIDLLAIRTGEVPETKGRVQIIQATEQELEERLDRGDDFAAWVLRFGKPVFGRRSWEELKARLSARERWPDPGIKRRKALEHLRAAHALDDLGDEEAAEEEARTALIHLARAVLLEHGVFPLSRPELSEQLEAIEAMQLARASISRDMPREELLSILDSELSPSEPQDNGG